LSDELGACIAARNGLTTFRRTISIGTRKPAIFAVDDEDSALATIERELRVRYGSAYEIVGERSAKSALLRLEAVRGQGDEVTLILSDQYMPEMTGVEFLTRARELHPDSKRGSLLTWETSHARVRCSRPWHSARRTTTGRNPSIPLTSGSTDS